MKKIFTACLGTETNTFASIPTGHQLFEETCLYRKGSYGGTGQAADWQAALELRTNLRVPLILAGGLTAQNVAAAIAAVFYAASAAMMALEVALGPIWARLAIALVLLAVAVAAYFVPRLIGRGTSAEPPIESSEPDIASMTRDQRIAMVFEALLLGFSMGSRKAATSADSSGK